MPAVDASILRPILLNKHFNKNLIIVGYLKSFAIEADSITLSWGTQNTGVTFDTTKQTSQHRSNVNYIYHSH